MQAWFPLSMGVGPMCLLSPHWPFQEGTGLHSPHHVQWFPIGINYLFNRIILCCFWWWLHRYVKLSQLNVFILNMSLFDRQHDAIYMKNQRKTRSQWSISTEPVSQLLISQIFSPKKVMDRWKEWQVREDFIGKIT